MGGKPRDEDFEESAQGSGSRTSLNERNGIR